MVCSAVAFASAEAFKGISLAQSDNVGRIVHCML